MCPILVHFRYMRTDFWKNSTVYNVYNVRCVWFVWFVWCKTAFGSVRIVSFVSCPSTWIKRSHRFHRVDRIYRVDLFVINGFLRILRIKKKLFFRRRLSLIQRGVINERGLGDADIKVLIICVVLSVASNCKCELKLPLTHSKVNVKVLCYHNERKNAILYHFKRPCNKLREKGLRIWGWSKHRGKLIRVTKLCFGLVNFRNH